MVPHPHGCFGSENVGAYKNTIREATQADDVEGSIHLALPPRRCCEEPRSRNAHARLLPTHPAVLVSHRAGRNALWAHHGDDGGSGGGAFFPQKGTLAVMSGSRAPGSSSWGTGRLGEAVVGGDGGIIRGGGWRVVW